MAAANASQASQAGPQKRRVYLPKCFALIEVTAELKSGLSMAWSMPEPPADESKALNPWFKNYGKLRLKPATHDVWQKQPSP